VVDPDIERLFAGLERADVEKVLRLAELRTFSPGATVLAQGDAPSGIYAIVSGSAEVVLPDQRDGELSVAELGPGAIVGEISALTGEPVSATVKAREELEVRVIPLGVFHELAEELPQLVQNLGTGLAAKLVQTNRRLSPPPSDRAIGIQGGDTAAVEALAESVAWHSRRRVALLVAGAEHGAAAFPEAREEHGVDTVRVSPDELDGALVQAMQRFRHVLVAPAPGQELPAGCDQVVTVEATDEAALGRTARKLLGVRVGLALGGGAIRGWAHFGVLRAFERNRIPIDVLAGTSSGAVVAALAAIPDTADEAIAKLEPVSSRMFRPRLARGSLLSS
jgi:NTE family protein